MKKYIVLSNKNRSIIYLLFHPMNSQCRHIGCQVCHDVVALAHPPLVADGVQHPRGLHQHACNTHTQEI